MNTFMSFIALLPFLSSTAHAWFDFEEIDNHFKRVEESFNSMRKNMVSAGMSKSWNISYHDSDERKGLVITVSNIETQEVNATVSDDDSTVTVVTDAGVIKVAAKNNWVTIKTEQRGEQRAKDKDHAHHAASVQTMSQSWTVKQALDVSKAAVNYQGADKTLTIVVPYSLIQTKGRTIPVSFQ